MNKVFACLAVLCLASAPLRAAAQELVFGVGAIDFQEQGQDSGVFDVSYRHRPFVQRRVASLAFGASANVTGEGDVFLGGGVWAKWQWENGWFVDLSVMPGAYFEGQDGNDLGSTFEIRSLAGLGYRFDNGAAVSAAVMHKSNAGIGSDNPGANAFLIRYHYGF